jgi:hypothetical protein
MKKIFLMTSIVTILIAIITLISCQKESQNESQSIAEISKNEISSTENTIKADSRAPLILGPTIENFTACGNYNSCSISSVIGVTKTNGVKITLNSVTSGIYNNLRYRFYTTPPSLTDPCNITPSPILDITCSQSVVYIANNVFANNTSYYLIITSGCSTSPIYTFTAGNMKGQSCGVPVIVAINADVVEKWSTCGLYQTGINQTFIFNTGVHYKKFNGFHIQLSALTHSTYNSSSGSNFLTYKVYDTTLSATAPPVANFSSNNQNVYAALASFEDNRKYKIVIQTPNGQILSQNYFFTTGSLKNKPC